MNPTMNPTSLKDRETAEAATVRKAIYREWDRAHRAAVRAAGHGKPAAVFGLYFALSSAIATRAMAAGISTSQLYFPEQR